MGRPKELTEEERSRLIAEGYRPVEVWVPDWNNPAFLARLQRECEAINESDRKSGVNEWLDEVSSDLWDDIPS
ncbi:MAG: antitoxin MazE-like protein [Pararhizobium sp.]